MQILDPYLVGQRIKRLCVKQALTPKMIVEQLGLASVQSVYNWYSGRTMPRIDNLVPLADLLGVSIDYLLHGSDFSDETNCPSESE